MLQPRSLQQRLAIYLIIPVALLLVLMGIAGFISARNLMLSQWREAAVLKLQRAVHQVDMRLNNIKEWIRIFHKSSGAQDPDVLHELVVENLKEQEGVDHVHLTWISPPSSSSETFSGRMSSRSQMYSNRTPAQRHHHMEMMRRFHSARIREITPPRFDETIDYETVSLISDLNDNKGQTIGRLEVVINFDMLIKDVRESGWWQSNKAYLVTEDGRILTGTVSVRRGSLADSDDPLERKTVKAMKTTVYGTILGAGHPPEEVSGFYKLKEAPWRLVMIAPGQAILAPIVTFRYYYFAISAGFILLIVFLIRTVTGRTAAAIRQVSKAAQRIASGDYGNLLPARTRDEVGELIRSFNTMEQQLEERMAMKQAMNLAMEVQQNLLPKKMPKIKGLDIAARSIYCDETGGDLYDFLSINGCNPDSIGVAVGDVSGHGIPAALLMATVRAFLKSRVTQPGSAAEVITDVNRLATRDTGETGQFMTLFYAAIDAGKKEFRWVRAGHYPAFVYDPSAESCAELKGRGMAIGVDSGYRYREGGMMRLIGGQILLIGTDGLWETHDKAGAMFGKDRLEAIIRKNAQASADRILRSIIEGVQNFRGSAKQEDDITLAVIKVIG